MLDDLRGRGHRPAEMGGFAQTGNALVRFDFDEQRRLCRHCVIGVVYRLGKRHFHWNRANLGNAHGVKDAERKIFLPAKVVAEKLSSTNEQVSYNTDAPET